MGAVSEEEIMKGSDRNGEKIFVSVRIRLLNEKEIARNDVSDWDCINDDTIIFRNNLSVPDRSVYPSAYTFDKVFGRDCSTRQVYEDGVKEIAFSVVSGINSSIFAYGQTSSGKTYTMSGVTEYTIADIYDYIETHKEREFFLRFSAMEIYNESVRDLLSSDSTPLRLLDDPERGTIVEKLTEETLKNWNHLKDLLSVCKAQRQVGETSLNETSSRSHQIIRLTIESSARKFLSSDQPSTVTATVNFVDLAGSERASQSLSAGSRLKEGCHINRSLLTLGTVIRKLSKGKNGHVPFRDSKLTRILHSSLDGNARTAIICTMSPARTHVEQSRNTLLFASCAKEVTTNAQVNVVVSDKALVKHLQRELARLENELKTSGTNSVASDSAALLREKDIQIEELKNEITKLTMQRDLAQIQTGFDYQYPKLRVRSSWDEENPTSDISVSSDSQSFDVGSFETPHKSDLHTTRSNSDKLYHQFPDGEENFLNNDSSQSLSTSPISSTTNPSKGWDPVHRLTDEMCDDICKDVRCVEIEESNTYINDFFQENPVISAPEEIKYPPLKKVTEFNPGRPFYDSPSPEEPPSRLMEKETSVSRCLQLSKSRSCKASFMSSLSSNWFEKIENTPSNMIDKDFTGRPMGISKKISALDYDLENDKLPKKDSTNMVEVRNITTSSDEDNVCFNAIEKMENHRCDEQLADTHASLDLARQVQETELETKEFIKDVKDVGLDPLLDDASETSRNWPIKFERLRNEIIDLWDECNVSLVHRTYFFLLFNGDFTDGIYMEVELRRLSFLKGTFSRGGQITEFDQTLTPSSSMKSLRREREMLSKQMLKKLSKHERESLYPKWGIESRTKNRRLQLAHRLWTVTNDMNHITESANLVAKLVSLLKPEQANKEMFGLNFTPSHERGKSFSWKDRFRSVL